MESEEMNYRGIYTCNECHKDTRAHSDVGNHEFLLLHSTELAR